MKTVTAQDIITAFPYQSKEEREMLIKQYARQVAEAIRYECCKKVSGLNRAAIYTIDIEKFIK